MTRYLRRVGQVLCAALAACAPKSERAKIGRHSEPLAEDTIIVLNRPIVTLRGPFLGISPAERAPTGRERVINVLERGGPGVVSVEKLEPGDAVKIDGALVFVLTRDDVARSTRRLRPKSARAARGERPIRASVRALPVRGGGDRGLAR